MHDSQSLSYHRDTLLLITFIITKCYSWLLPSIMTLDHFLIILTPSSWHYWSLSHHTDTPNNFPHRHDTTDHFPIILTHYSWSRPHHHDTSDHFSIILTLLLITPPSSWRYWSLSHHTDTLLLLTLQTSWHITYDHCTIIMTSLLITVPSSWRFTYDHCTIIMTHHFWSRYHHHDISWSLYHHHDIPWLLYPQNDTWKLLEHVLSCSWWWC